MEQELVKRQDSADWRIQQLQDNMIIIQGSIISMQRDIAIIKTGLDQIGRAIVDLDEVKRMVTVMYRDFEKKNGSG